ncbi:glycosyltransferase family 2 protein [Nonlabens agnitus]|uniref:Galactosyltransferase C-terminal domain-containing protein n=1 Tax=Nonlabens agnitus TaxID=870484 RepID=A0A2S9WU37_9FLAO|nr:glycosyltransferase family A protein [Nonlabens agnitus]PRP66991.1 hypothetical protein BST86_07705 [Nonlabens agnitus]
MLSIPTLSIVIPNRNRKLEIVQRSLDSVAMQLNQNVKVMFIDYGSSKIYQEKLQNLLTYYPAIELKLCPTQGQLFHKTRCINMVLKQCTSKYFMVMDVDCIVHPKFVAKALELASDGTTYNFPYGFLTEAESNTSKPFEDHKVKFIGGLTGTAIFNTEQLIQLNGFDESYHGWGAEDADMFRRLETAGNKVVLYQSELLVLHQWHAKGYRSTNTNQPFHQSLERINHRLFDLSKSLNSKVTNRHLPWGMHCSASAYNQLDVIVQSIFVENSYEELRACSFQLLHNQKPGTTLLTVREMGKIHSLKNRLKAIFSNRVFRAVPMEQVNEYLLEQIIMNFRNLPYQYEFDQELRQVKLKINF